MLSLLWKKYHLLLWLALILLAGFLMTSLANYWVARAQIRDNIANQGLPLTGDTVYSEIQKDVLRPTFISSLMANDTFVRDWILAGEEDASRIVRYLSEVKEKYSTVSAFLVSDKTGRYYYPDGVLKTVSEQEPRDVWFYRVRQLQTPYEMNLDVDLANGDAITIFINYRVVDFDGNFIGVTGVGLTLEALADVIADVQRRFNRRVYFVNQQGDIIASDYHGSLQKESIHTRPGIKGIADQIINNSVEPTRLEYSRGENHILLSSRYIPELQWYLVVEQTDAEALEEVRKVLLGNMFISALITLLVLLLTLYSVNRYQRRLENVAATDALTGLINRHAFEFIFNQAVYETQRTPAPLSVILLDIDHFKSINDTYGHLAGDQALLEVTALLVKGLRDGDVLCRWGGEEFLVLLKNTAADAAGAVAEKLRRAMELDPLQLEGQHLHITGSFGVVAYQPGETLVELFARVDSALYAAKAAGRNRVEFS